MKRNVQDLNDESLFKILFFSFCFQLMQREREGKVGKKGEKEMFENKLITFLITKYME